MLDYVDCRKVSYLSALSICFFRFVGSQIYFSSSVISRLTPETPGDPLIANTFNSGRNKAVSKWRRPRKTNHKRKASEN